MKIQYIELMLGQENIRLGKSVDKNTEFSEVEPFSMADGLENGTFGAINFSCKQLNGRIKIIKPNGVKIPIDVNCLAFKKGDKRRLKKNPDMECIAQLKIEKRDIIKFSLYPSIKYNCAQFASIIQKENSFVIPPFTRFSINELPLSHVVPENKISSHEEIFDQIIHIACNRLLLMTVPTPVKCSIKQLKEAIVITNSFNQSIQFHSYPLCKKMSYDQFQSLLKKSKLFIYDKQSLTIYDFPAEWIPEPDQIASIKETNPDREENSIITEAVTNDILKDIDISINQEETRKEQLFKSITYHIDNKTHCLTLSFKGKCILNTINEEIPEKDIVYL